jgi:hypothetical protein
MSRLAVILAAVLAFPAAAQANWWDDVGPIKDPQKAKLASRMGIYTQGGWDQHMRGSTGGIPNAFLANAALHPEAQVMVGGMTRQLGNDKNAPAFSWKRLTPGAAEDLLAGRTTPTVDTRTQGCATGRIELTYPGRNGKEKTVTVPLSARRQLVVAKASGQPITSENRVQFLKQTATGLRAVKTRPLAGYRYFAR